MKQIFVFAVVVGIAIAILLLSREKKPTIADTEKSTVVAYRQLVFALGDPKLTREEKYVAYRMLLEANEDAIPVLIEALDDRRICDLGYYIWPSGPAGGSHQKPTVGDAVRSLLYRLVRPYPSSEFFVDDWQEFWQEYKGKKLNEIQRLIHEKYPPTGHKGSFEDK